MSFAPDLSLCLPAYRRSSICDVMPSVLSLWDIPGVDDVLGLRRGVLSGVNRVAILLLDGLGLYPLQLAAQRSQLFANMLRGQSGEFEVLTTNFPSTTPVSLTSLGTGAMPGEHGVLGFTVAVPGTTDILTHIEWGVHPDPLTWQPVSTGFEHAAAVGISTAKVSQVFPFDGLNTAAFRGSDTLAAADPSAVADGVIAALHRGDRSLVYGYHSAADKAGHSFGLESPQWWEAIESLEALVSSIVERLPSDAGLVITADHGMVNVDDSDKFEIRDHPELMDGVTVIAGEPRARYVHTEPGAADDVRQRWENVYGTIADVRTRQSAIDAGWFGPVPDEHKDRIGDVVVAGTGMGVILGVAGERRTIKELRGYHGGLTAAEMQIGMWCHRGMS